MEKFTKEITTCVTRVFECEQFEDFDDAVKIALDKANRSRVYQYVLRVDNGYIVLTYPEAWDVFKKNPEEIAVAILKKSSIKTD